MPEIGGAGLICGNIVLRKILLSVVLSRAAPGIAHHTACVGGGFTIYKRAPDVEVLTSTSHGIGTTIVTQ